MRISTFLIGSLAFMPSCLHWFLFAGYYSMMESSPSYHDEAVIERPAVIEEAAEPDSFAITPIDKEPEIPIPPAPKDMKYTPIKNSLETIKLKKGEGFEIALDANATTGFQWHIMDDNTYGRITLDEEFYEVDDHEEGMTGVGGTKYYRFRAYGTGNASFTLEYKRSWEDDPIKVVKYDFEISE